MRFGWQIVEEQLIPKSIRNIMQKLTGKNTGILGKHHLHIVKILVKNA